MVKNIPVNAGDEGSIPKSGRSPEEGNGNPAPYSCLRNPWTERTWGAPVHGVTKESDRTEPSKTAMLAQFQEADFALAHPPLGMKM